MTTFLRATALTPFALLVAVAACQSNKSGGTGGSNGGAGGSHTSAGGSHSGTGGSNGGAGGSHTGSTGSTMSTSSGSTVDCGCSCAEVPNQLWFCSCPGQQNIDCCPDSTAPTCAGGVAPGCAPGPSFGWFCPCEGQAVPNCPVSAPAACAPGVIEYEPSDDTWSCAGCDPAAPPPCSAGSCPVCNGGSWSCSTACPGTGGAGGGG